MARPLARIGVDNIQPGYRMALEDVNFSEFRRTLLYHFDQQTIRAMVRQAFKPAGKILVRGLRQASPRRTGGLRRSFRYQIQHRLDRTRGGSTAIGSHNVGIGKDRLGRYDAQTGQEILLAGTTTKGGKEGWKLGFVNRGTKHRWNRDYRDDRGRWRPMKKPAYRGRNKPQHIARNATDAVADRALEAYQKAFVTLADAQMRATTGRGISSIKSLRPI